MFLCMLLYITNNVDVNVNIISLKQQLCEKSIMKKFSLQTEYQNISLGLKTNRKTCLEKNMKKYPDQLKNVLLQFDRR